MGNNLRCCLLGLLAVVSAAGCRICADCDLDSYTAYGGRWHRTDRNHGRVGSVFAPAGAQVPYDESVVYSEAASPAEPQPTPTPVEELEPGIANFNALMDMKTQWKQ